MVVYESFELILVLAAVLSIVHFFSSEISEKIERYHSKLISLSAGIFISLLFLDILPKLLETEFLSITSILSSVLVGIIVFHIAEKYLYQHIKHRKELLKDLAELHFIGFFINHLILGFILVVAIGSNILIFIPLLLHTIASSISLEHIHEKFKSTLFKRIFLASSTFMGAIVALLLSPIQILNLILFSFTVGIVLYISFRDMVPKEKEGSSLFFL